MCSVTLFRLQPWLLLFILSGIYSGFVDSLTSGVVMMEEPEERPDPEFESMQEEFRSMKTDLGSESFRLVGL